MNESSQPNQPIHFNGKEYNRIDEMPVDERALFEHLQAIAADNPPSAAQPAGLPQPPTAQAETAENSGAGAVPPAIPAGFEGVTGLGPVVSVYKAKKFKQWIIMGIGGGVFAAGGGLVLAALAAALFPGAIHPFADQVSWGTVFMVAGGLGWLIPLINWRVRRGKLTTLVVYRDGFAYRKGGEILSDSWTGVERIIIRDKLFAQGASGWTYHRAAIHLKNGGLLIVDDDQFDDAAGMAHALKTPVYALLLPPAQAAYAAGAVQTFGAVSVSKASGIEADGYRIGWDDVKTIAVKRGRLIVSPKEAKAVEVKVEQIPNVEILCQLIGLPAASLQLAYF